MRNKLATVLTGAMLVLTTNALPSSALNTTESSVTNTAAKLENPINQTQTTKNSELLLAQRSRRRGWRTRQYKCRRKRVYSPRRRRVIRVKECRRVQVKTFYPRYF